MPRREAARKSSRKSKAHSQTWLVCRWKRRSPRWRNSASGQGEPDRNFPKRRSTGALQDASESCEREITATFWSAAALCRFSSCAAKSKADEQGLARCYQPKREGDLDQMFAIIRPEPNR